MGPTGRGEVVLTWAQIPFLDAPLSTRSSSSIAHSRLSGTTDPSNGPLIKVLPEIAKNTDSGVTRRVTPFSLTSFRGRGTTNSTEDCVCENRYRMAQSGKRAARGPGPGEENAAAVPIIRMKAAGEGFIVVPILKAW